MPTPTRASHLGRRALYRGDNLSVLRRFVADDSVDLVYLDPPFNTGRDHVFTATTRGGAVGRAFRDSWRWGRGGAADFAELADRDDSEARALTRWIGSLRETLGSSDVLAHLVMVGARLIEAKRVLRRTGSLYVHCDATASHYLKVALDLVMEPQNFRREIVWRSGWASGFKAAAPNWVRNHDVLLYYVKDRRAPFVFNKALAYRAHAPGYRRRGGKHGRLGIAIDDVWDETALYSPGIKSFSREKLGYPTQKPLALLERIVNVSSRAGEVVLDPFCGSGTCPAAAERLARGWIAIDSSRRAIEVTRRRLWEQLGLRVRAISA